MHGTSNLRSCQVIAAATAAALVAACSASSGTESAFLDPSTDDGGDSGGSYTSSSSGAEGGGSADATGSSGGQRATEAGDDVVKVAPCRGTPASCASQTDETSCSALGCSWAGMCAGSALPCAGLDASKCGVQQNCTYDNLTGQCSGTVFACNVLAAAYGCTTQQGCSWQMGCTGTASVTCASFGDSATCSGAGCTWN
jgi:hypothetical protein